MKTSELIGPALDWAVAKCENLNSGRHFGCFYPSTDWAQGGPIIERERISVDNQTNVNPERWGAVIWGVVGWFYGDSILEAAMRCYVASKLGDEVEIPEELK